MNLRPYDSADAAAIVSWVQNERELRQWSADRFADSPYPLTAERLDAFYASKNPLLHPMTATENGVPMGHVLLRWPEEGVPVVRLGFVIVNRNRRGTGLGQELVSAACCYAAGMMGAERVTLGVFLNNPAAGRCYRAAGFRTVKTKICRIGAENWRCAEMVLEPESSTLQDA